MTCVSRRGPRFHSPDIDFSGGFQRWLQLYCEIPFGRLTCVLVEDAMFVPSRRFMFSLPKTLNRDTLGALQNSTVIANACLALLNSIRSAYSGSTFAQILTVLWIGRLSCVLTSSWPSHPLCSRRRS